MHWLVTVVSAMSVCEVVCRCQCQVIVRTDDLDLAGEVVQDAAAYLGLADLESTAHFPSHMQEFQAVMGKVSTHHLDSHNCVASAAYHSVCTDKLSDGDQRLVCSPVLCLKQGLASLYDAMRRGICMHTRAVVRRSLSVTPIG